MSRELIERSNTILESRKLMSPAEEATAEAHAAPVEAALRTAITEKYSFEGAKLSSRIPRWLTRELNVAWVALPLCFSGRVF